MRQFVGIIFFATLLLLLCDEKILAQTKIDINTVSGPGTGYTWNSSTSTLTITDDGIYTVEGSGSGSATTNRIVASPNLTVNITLNNVNIDVSSVSDDCTFATPDDITANGQTICLGETASLTASLTASSSIAGASFKWYDSQTSTTVLSSSATYSPNPPPTAETKYYVSVTGTDYCENAAGDRKEVTVTVNPLPTLTNDISGDNEVCVGSTITLSNATVGGTWSSSDPLKATVAGSSGVVSGVAPGDVTITYTVTDANGCSASKTKNITVNSIQPDATGRVYVKEGGAGSMDGSSWANAYPGLADPLLAAGNNTACSEIKQIWVASGTYYPQHIAGTGATDRDKSFVMVKGVKVYGGFNASAPESSVAARATTTTDGIIQMTNQTILSGDLGVPNDKADNAFHVVIYPGNMVNGTDTARLDGFTITGGCASVELNDNDISISGYGWALAGESGAGIYIANSSPILTNLLVTGNTTFNTNGHGAGIFNDGGVFDNAGCFTVITNVIISGNTSAGYGGGMFNYENSSPLMTKVLISGNKAALGGGIANYINCSPVLTDVQISGNTATGSGGGMLSLTSCSPVLTNVRIIGNKATGSGGGITSSGACVDFLTNVQITGNTANNNGGAIYHYSGCRTNLNNVTVAGNYAQTNYGGVYLPNTTDKQVRNSIIYGNVSGGTFQNVNSEDAAIYGNSLVGDATLNAGIILNDDPKFAQEAYATDLTPTTDGDYSLTVCSPAINAGDNALCSSVVTTDLAGNPRIRKLIVDLGAFESDSEGLPAVADISGESSVCVGSPTTLSSTTNGGTWSSSDTDKATVNSSTGEVTGVASGNVTISYSVTNSNNCTTTKTKAITVKPSPDYPDLRVRVCPDVSKDINMLKYIDTLDVGAQATWSGLPVDYLGVVAKNNLPQSGVFTLVYTMYGGCTTEKKRLIQRTVYLEVLKNKRSRMLRDSIVVCYKNASALQINQLFGIEADGEWLYNDAPLASGDIGSYVNVSQSTGAVVLDGKKLYKETNNVPLVTWSDGSETKTVAVSYKAKAECLKDEVFTVKIVLSDE